MCVFSIYFTTRLELKHLTAELESKRVLINTKPLNSLTASTEPPSFTLTGEKPKAKQTAHNFGPLKGARD